MADFVAVLRKTIGALGDNTPEMREKVYEKARATIEAKLLAIQPPPPAAVVDRQRKALEDAIAVVRADYAEPPGGDADEDLEDVFASLKSMGDVKTPPPPPPPPAVSAPPASPPPASQPSLEKREAFSPSPARPDPVLDPPEMMRAADDTTDAADRGTGAPENGDGAPTPPEALVATARERHTAASSRSRRPTGLIAALVLLLALAGGGYAVWLNKDDLFGSSPPPPSTIAEAEPEEDGVTTAEELVEAAPQEEPEAIEEEDGIAALPPSAEEEAEASEPAGQSAAGGAEKFTQRLLADGSEVDDGPAGGQRTVGEGTSVAAASQASPPDTASDAEAEAGAAEPDEAAGQTPAVAVGQRAIFYEERTSSAQGSAELGSIVWSVVREAPGSDLPAEPAIRAEANVPGKDVQLRMTIRRNGDETLPASHIVEMIFLTPEGFEGGTITNVSRISFKETEQAAGSPLIGIPAKIADGFFLIALGDAPAEVEANMTLLRRQSWIDIPIVYQSGRRALLSLEKGIPGDRVFQEALQAWAEASSG